MLEQFKSSLKKENTAFTFVELLLAISIFAVVASCVYTTFYLAVRSYKIIHKEMRMNRKLIRFLDRLDIELRNCYAAEYNEDDAISGFIGGSHNISFSTIKDIYGDDGLEKIVARVSYNFREGKLFKKIQLYDSVFLDKREWEDKEILSGIKELSFKYLYFRQPQNNYEWKNNWLNKSAVPKGILLEINLDGVYIFERYIYLAQGEVIGG
jgi:type II secretion system protein J